MSKVKVSIEGHYEVQEMPYEEYVWQPSHAIIACDCSQVMELDERHTTCPNCGTGHSDLMRQVAGRHLSDNVLHPWHRDYEEWQRFKEGRGEYQEWLEQRALDLDNEGKGTA